MRYYKIFVDNTNGLYTYCDKNDEFEIGQRVVVSFRNRKRTGLIIARDSDEEREYKVLPIQKVVENSLTLSEEYIKLLVWIKKYYLSSYEAVISSAIPSDLSIKYENIYKVKKLDDMMLDDKIEIDFIKLIEEKSGVTKNTLNKNFGKDLINEMLEKSILTKTENTVYLINEKIVENEFQQRVVDYFNQRLQFKEKYLVEKIGEGAIRYALKKEYIVLEKEYKNSTNVEEIEIDEDIATKSKVLNEEQALAREQVINGKEPFYLIKGVTGSGKTEVYISIIKEGFKNGKGSIFLVPEISLTPQMIGRFKGEFKENIAILHSKMTNKERANEWYNIYSGKKKIVLGVRSAIFAPVQNLGYIFLDEEHENTYKQDNNPRYNAKQVAIMRGQFEGAKVILGSATPSIESFYHAKQGMLKLIELKNRYNNASMPKIELIDMKEEKNLYFSEKLLDEIRSTLLKKEQVLLLLNRKGYSTYIQCGDCGHVEECSHCSIKYSYYASQGVMKCNYCGQTKKYTGHCSKCGSKNLIHSGKGVERVEEEIKKYFDVNVVRVDSEISKDRDYFDRVYYDFLNKKYDIMIGTQLISKGLHFPDVTLVGVINADTILNFPDFRAGEKTFQLMLQVAGRAGREAKEGRVLIQTYQPESVVFKKIVEDDYEGFYNYEIGLRELLGYPPFGKVINIGVSSTGEKYLESFVKDFYNDIKYDKIDMFRPHRSLVYKVKDRYRYNIFIKGSKKEINRFKSLLKRKLANYENNNKVRIVVDVDPINLI